MNPTGLLSYEDKELGRLLFNVDMATGLDEINCINTSWTPLKIDLVSHPACAEGLVWFGLVSLFNGISTLFRLFNAKAILLEQ